MTWFSRIEHPTRSVSCANSRTYGDSRVTLAPWDSAEFRTPRTFKCNLPERYQNALEARGAFRGIRVQVRGIERSHGPEIAWNSGRSE